MLADILPLFLFVIASLALIWAIRAFIHGEVTIKYRNWLGVYREEILDEENSRRFSAFYILGSLLILLSIILGNVFEIQSAVLGILFIGGVFVYGIAFFVIDNAE
ncbi:MAG: hypothetical protein AAFR81_11440 [Chloroflexota bacterium]